MEFKEIQPIQSHIIEDVDGSLYRRNFEDGWEQMENGGEWYPVYYSEGMEKEFQEYLKSKEDGQMSEETAPYIVSIPNPNAAWTGRATSDHTFTGIPPTTSQKTAYIPTPFVVPPELKVGDKWYIKYQRGFCGLTEVEIKEVTEKTVVLQSLDDRLHIRYKKSDIEFVEKVNDE